MSARVEGTLRLAGWLVATGLAVEIASLLWKSPLAFVLFAAASPLLIGAGVVMFLLALVRRD